MRTYLTDFIKDTPCKFKALGEVAEVGTGSSNGNEAVDNGKYPLFVRSKIVKSINTFEFDEEAIVIPGEGLCNFFSVNKVKNPLKVKN